LNAPTDTMFNTAAAALFDDADELLEEFL